MTITVGSNAYVSIEDADAYWTERGDTVWSAASEAAKEVAIILATQYMDACYKWVGRIEDEEQLLGWPRLYAYDGEGRTLEDTPQKVADACCELAKIALNGPLVPSGSAERIKREKIGNIEVEYADSGATGAYAGYDTATILLRGIGSFKNGNGMVKLARA
jgi:hypothetical protein